MRGTQLHCLPFTIARNYQREEMQRSDDTRKRFRAALALAGLTQEQWAEQEGVTPSHLSRVLAGERDSQRLMDRLSAFTRKYVKSVA